MATTISAEDFTFLRDLILREAAIVLDTGKEYLAISRLEPVARQQGLDGIPALVRALRSNPGGKLRDQVIDAMTTNETLFFRDSHPFESLQKLIMPTLMKARPSRTLDIWCAAASTGQEPYSLAMLLRENFPELASWKVRILGTDISPTALDRARAGKYTQMEVGRGLPARYLVKYFGRAGVEWQIKPEIGSMVDYRLFNLAANWPPMGPFDLIFIRNVLIYFNQETKTQIIDKASRMLRPDGFLMMGSTESLLNIQTNMERVQFDKTSCYRVKSSVPDRSGQRP